MLDVARSIIRLILKNEKYLFTDFDSCHGHHCFNGIFDKTICCLIVTGELKDFFFLCIYNKKKKKHPQCNFSA